MAAQEYLFGLVDARGEVRRAPVVGMQFLHQRPVRPRDIVPRRAFTKPQDFIGFLLRHLPRSPRSPIAAGSAPRVTVLLSCLTPTGEAAVEIRL
jgi:hypothetical protein